MIDKPNGKMEELLHFLYGKAAKLRSAIKKMMSPATNFSEKFKRRRPFIYRSILAVLLIILCAAVAVGFSNTRKVYVTIDDSLERKTTEYDTNCFRLDTFLEKHSIDYNADTDKINMDSYSILRNGSEIIIEKPFDAVVYVDGEERSCSTFALTPAELIKKLKIEIKPDDIVTPSLDTVLKKGDRVSIQRVEYEFQTETVTVPYDSTSKWTDSVTIGEVAVVQEGITGLVENTYYVTYIDGKEHSRELKESKVTREKVDKVTGFGTKILKGVPSDLKYKQVINNVKAVSYYMEGSRRGVYGKRCEYGTVAVDRDVIPLGSLLYIEGYGYAIANDVGSGIKGNTVDLYMEKYRQCVIWGARNVRVYIIEYGNNKRYWEH